MKTDRDVKNRLAAEIKAVLPAMMNDPFERFYLYYIETKPEHNGGFMFCREQPENKDYMLACGTHINPGHTEEQIFGYFYPIIRRLPILEVA